MVVGTPPPDNDKNDSDTKSEGEMIPVDSSTPGRENKKRLRSEELSGLDNPISGVGTVDQEIMGEKCDVDSKKQKMGIMKSNKSDKGASNESENVACAISEKRGGNKSEKGGGASSSSGLMKEALSKADSVKQGKEELPPDWS